MELEDSKRGDQTACLTMAAISRVYTISHVAKMLGEDEEFLWEIAVPMMLLTVRNHGAGFREGSSTAFLTLR